MIEGAGSLLLLLVPVWPLLLAGALGLGVERSWVWHLGTWAALPALATVAMPDTVLTLPRAMLGGSLVLDASGRVFLLISAVLWLASGMLARAWFVGARPRGAAVLWLLAMAGNFGLVLAGDVLLFFAASTLAGYALYGTLRCGADAPTQRAANVLVIFLVVSDLLVFELLVMLGQSAPAMDFSSFRRALLNADSRALMLGLVLGGFGIKMGILGLHFWLPAVFIKAHAELRPAVVTFMLGAGLLATLRLFPLGQFEDATVAEIFGWLSWAALLYAFLGGLSKSHPRAIFAQIAVASSGLWLMVLSACFKQPRIWSDANEPLAVTFIQWGLAFTALLLISNQDGETGEDVKPSYFAAGQGWLAVVLMATAPLGIVGIADNVMVVPLVPLFIAVIAFLAFLSLLISRKTRAATPSEVPAARPDIHTAVRARSVTALTTLSAVAFVFNVTESSLSEVVFVLLVIVGAALTATAMNRINVPERVLMVSRPDALSFLFFRRLRSVQKIGRRLGEISVMQWLQRRQAGLWVAARLRANRLARRLESQITSWPAGLVLMLSIGLLVAWIGSQA